MYEQIALLKPGPHALLVRLGAEKSSIFLHLVAPVLAFLAFWYTFVLSWQASLPGNAATMDWLTWTLVLAPLLAIPLAIHHFRQHGRGESYEIDGTTRTVKRNGRDLTRSGRIRGVELRRIFYPAEGDEYRLTLLLDDGSKIVLWHTRDRERVVQVTDEIAGFLGVEAVWK